MLTMLHMLSYINCKVYTIKVFIGTFFLLSGCYIYLLFRSKTLRIYQWCSAMGLSDSIDVCRGYVQDWHISDVVKYSLPDGLYNAAYILFMDAIWSKVKSSYKYAIILLVPFFTITSELLQYYGIIKGTYDVYDLACYSVPVIIYIIIQMININNFKTNNV